MDRPSWAAPVIRRARRGRGRWRGPRRTTLSG